jgi:hypothetical protein
VRRRLAENGLKPWRKDMWCIPRVDGEYAARMEDVLDIYAEAPDPRHAETHADAGWTDQRQIVVGVDPFALDELLEQGAVETAGTAKPSSQNRTQKLHPEGLANQALGADRFRGFFKGNIRDWMAPIERFIFWAISPRSFFAPISRSVFA